MLMLAAASLAFAPPLDTPLLYEIVERHATSQGERVFTIRVEATFARDGDGYRLTIHTLSYQAAAPGSQRDRFDAAMVEAGRVPIRIHLSRDGVPDHVIDATATWNAYVAAIRSVATPAAPDPLATGYADKLASLPPEAREAQLLENADVVVASHIAPVASGQVVADGAATLTREPDRDGESRFHRTTDRAAPNGGRIAIDEEIAIAPATGLVTHKLRTVTLNAPGMAPNVVLSREDTHRVK